MIKFNWITKQKTKKNVQQNYYTTKNKKKNKQTLSLSLSSDCITFCLHLLRLYKKSCDKRSITICNKTVLAFVKVNASSNALFQSLCDWFEYHEPKKSPSDVLWHF